MQKQRRDNFHDRRGPGRKKRRTILVSHCLPCTRAAGSVLTGQGAGQSHVRAMSEPGISLHPISETDEEMTTRSRARSQHGKSSIITWGEKSSSLYLSYITHITYTREEKEQTKKRKRKKDFFLVFESDSHTLPHYTPTLGGR